MDLINDPAFVIPLPLHQSVHQYVKMVLLEMRQQGIDIDTVRTNLSTQIWFNWARPYQEHFAVLVLSDNFGTCHLYVGNRIHAEWKIAEFDRSNDAELTEESLTTSFEYIRRFLDDVATSLPFRLVKVPGYQVA